MLDNEKPILVTVYKIGNYDVFPTWLDTLMRVSGVLCINKKIKIVRVRKPRSQPSRPKTKKDKKQKMQQDMYVSMGSRAIGAALVNRTKSKKAAADSFPAMHPCTVKFATAVANPFSPDAMGVCLPTTPARPSQKIAAFTRGSGAVGTHGFGYIVIMPSLTSSQPCAFVTNSAYTGTGADTFNVFSAADVIKTGVVSTSFANLPYASSDIWTNTTNNPPPCSGRIVSVGVKLVYTGTLTNTSGIIASYSDPAHSTLLTSTTHNSLLAYTETVICPNQPGDMCVMSMAPVGGEELEFGNTTLAEGVSSGNPASLEYQTAMIYPWSRALASNLNSVSVVGNPIGVVSLQGLVASTTFYYEIVMHVEYVGVKPSPFLTPSFADPVGLGNVISVAGKVPLIKASNPKNSWGNAFMQALKEVGRELKPVAGAVAKNMILGAIAAL